jgi:hypothetical protein
VCRLYTQGASSVLPPEVLEQNHRSHFSAKAVLEARDKAKESQASKKHRISVAYRLQEQVPRADLRARISEARVEEARVPGRGDLHEARAPQSGVVEAAL